MCLNPTLIKNKRYVPTKKNNGIAAVCDDNRKLYVPIGCGYCSECRKQRASGWKIRLLEEGKKSSEMMKFITLSISDESILKLDTEEIKGEANGIATRAVRLWLKRLNKKGMKIKHWLCTELGEEATERVHLHGIVWGQKAMEMLEEWGYGNIVIKEFWGERTIGYVVKYIMKVPKKQEFMPKILASKGIGKNYTEKNFYNKFENEKTKDNYKLPNGAKVALPIYYRNKIFTEDQRGFLWTEKLDKGIRYIAGKKVDANDEKKIRRMLKRERERDREIGYNEIGYEEAKIKRKQIKASNRYWEMVRELNELTKIYSGQGVDGERPIDD